MRLALASLVLTASIVVAVFVLAAPAKAAWPVRQAVDGGSVPTVRTAGFTP